MADSDLPAPATTYAEVERALLARWPETKLDPSLERIAAFTELLGEPQKSYPVLRGGSVPAATFDEVKKYAEEYRASHK